MRSCIIILFGMLFCFCLFRYSYLRIKEKKQRRVVEEKLALWKESLKSMSDKELRKEYYKWAYDLAASKQEVLENEYRVSAVCGEQDKRSKRYRSVKKPFWTTFLGSLNKKPIDFD